MTFQSHGLLFEDDGQLKVSSSSGSGSSSSQVQGPAAHGATASGNPLRLGARYRASPATVSDGQMTDILVDEYGQIKVVAVGTATIQQSLYSNGTTTGVPANATAVTLMAANTSRRELIIKNSSISSGILYYKYGSGAAISSGNYVESLAPGDSAYINTYNGLVTGIWDSATTGFANITEVA